ncbi:MAG: ROK family glucokinase [Oscillospiraceae bacterium]|nr:ROK family glucokinase [Oscillospiraceae bacterium]
MQYGFGVDLGGTTVKIAYFDKEGTLLTKWEIPTDTSSGGRNILPDIAAAIEAFIAGQGVPREEILGVGIGVPGAVDKAGVIYGGDNLGWGTFSVKDVLTELTGLPVAVGNDANVAALGESWMGGAKEFQNMVMVTLGTGVGGGIVVDGQLVVGAGGGAGEIGHMTLNREETESCGCGKRGCVEQYCSATGIVRMARRMLEKREEPSCLREQEQLTAKAVFDGAKAGDALAMAVTAQFFAYMGEFLSNICCVTAPEVILLGGGVSKAGAFLLEGVRQAFGRVAYHAHLDTRFALATLGNDAGVYGAFKLIRG